MDLDDLDDEELLSFDNKEEEQQRRPAQSGRRFKPGQRRPVEPIQEDEADCRPPSQQDAFSNLANFKQQQRRIRQTPSPKQRGAMKPPTRQSRTTYNGKGQNNEQTMEKDQTQQPEESAQITEDPTSEESSAGSPI